MLETLDLTKMYNCTSIDHSFTDYIAYYRSRDDTSTALIYWQKRIQHTTKKPVNKLKQTEGF